MAKLIGIKIVATKSGKDGYEYHFADEFDEYSKNHAECYGKQVFTEYSQKLFKAKVGDEVILVYGKGYQGKAQLIDIHNVTDNKLKMNKQA